jgi:hypothetical protein
MSKGRGLELLKNVGMYLRNADCFDQMLKKVSHEVFEELVRFT